MTIHVRKCPGCQEERPEEEPLCAHCGWDLTQEPLRLPGQIDPIQTNSSPQPALRYCLNGHPLEAGDELCFKCGATAAQEEGCTEESSHSSETVIDGWVVIDRLDTQSASFEKFIVERHGHRALLTFYLNNINPDPSIYEVLKRLPKDYVPELLAHGNWQGRQYDVIGQNSQPNLFDLMTGPVDLEAVRQIVKSTGRILCTLAENGLRHGNLRPENILISHRDPLGLLLTGFQYSRLSRFDLDTVPQPISEQYTAPEAIVGGISVSSDWWSLGMVILHLITKGQCFEGINEKAFRIHIVTRGVSLPKGIDPSLNLLLRGLLARDPDQRWQWTQVQSWLAGESVDAPFDSNFEETHSGPTLEFNNHSYVCPKAFALAAGEAANWEQAKDLLMRGVIVTWLEDRKVDSKILAGVRAAASLDSLSDDYKHALALMWMNSSLPLLYKGEIVTSPWLLQNPIQGYEIITSPLIRYLRQMNREPQLCELYNRMERARKKAKVLEIELNEESFRVVALASSRQNLERQWAIHRRLYPGSDHSGLNSLMEREKITDEDLMILLGGQVHQYQSAEQIFNQAHTLASQVEVSSYEETGARQWVDVSRKELYREIEGRIANYSRCGIPRVDEWANDFRIERRISLPRALILLSIPKESWHEPPRQQYVSCLLEFFEKRTSSQAQKGPLVRMRIGKSNTVVDLARIEGEEPKASSILEHLISRIETPVRIDRTAFLRDSDLERRLRHLVSRAQTYKRDTGIDSLYLGFPFLVMRESRSDTSDTKPKIPPILLWPIKIDIENRDRVSIFFDRDREEVRVNPALIGLIGIEEAKKWIDVTKELLERSSIRTGEVIDAFSVLADPRERAICALPDSDYKVKPGSKQVVCSAVFFHAEFMGQAIGEDLRQMRKESLAGTALETALRVNKGPMVSPQFLQIPERDRYFTMETDPSQERAVFHARQSPGLLIEGPPGTGKSQTIVNIICDCIGRNQTVLVVCQKSAALEVLAKRLDAEGLREQFFYITNVNKDRSSVVQNIRAQIERIVQTRRVYQSENLERERSELAEKIEKLEREVDKHHEAIHAIDEQTGLSYRMLLGQLIDLEDQGSKLIDAPELRRHVADLRQNQLSLIEEEGSPIASIWLESSYEMSPLAKLKVFSSDTASAGESITAFFSFITAEEKRDKVYQMSTLSFDIQDPFPYQDWIKFHDQLLKKVDWERIASWFQLFSPRGELEGPRIVKQLEELKQQLIFLNLNKHDQKLSSKLVDVPMEKIEAWLSLARKATSLNPLCFVQRASFQKQLEELKKELSSLDSNKYDQKLSNKLIDVPLEKIEWWMVLARKSTNLNPLCFIQTESLLKTINELNQRLYCLELNNKDQVFFSRLIDIPLSTLDQWIVLVTHHASPMSYLSFFNPLRLIRTYRIKKILSMLSESLSLEAVDRLRVAAELEKERRLVRETVLLQIKNIYPEAEISKPISLKDLRLCVNRMIEDLTNVSQLQKIISSLGEDPGFEKANLFQGVSELEIKMRPIRTIVFNIFRQFYQRTEPLGLSSLEEMCGQVVLMLEDLLCITQLQKVLLDLREDKSFERACQFKTAADLEYKLRPLRITISAFLGTLYQNTKVLKPISLRDLLYAIDGVINDLHIAQSGILAIHECPRQEGIEAIIERGLPAYLDFISQYEAAFARYQARTNSLSALERLSAFFSEDLFSTLRANIQDNRSNFSELRPIADSLPSLSAYQEFRLHVPSLSLEALRIFSVLREKDKELKGYPKDQLAGIIKRLIGREARLAWKDRIEQKFPVLRLSQKELIRKVRSLDEANTKIRELNQRFLASNRGLKGLSSTENWEDITRLRGPRARRLRELIERGTDMGLMQLRSVWLMNPDTASRLLPLRAGMFDVVIYDEASQIPVENALPTLYRAKRCIISGDDKQMPPTSAFKKRFSDDEEQSFDDEDLDEIMSEAEREALEDTWNRKEIKDCADLLTLGKMVLPRSMLQIHYRSRYRELIAFSNAAFYGNQLSIPVRHPESVIQKIRPIEVIRVDGIYTDQTNREEAEKVVDLLAERWSSAERPSIGIVTFNIKQADLIEDILAERSANHLDFRQALSSERERQQGGEDMSFFVKNVENVQGDERDMIIFSSTFGRDDLGSFRRQFGLLGQTGGERRLNVGITRAREKIILVTSLPINEISDALSKHEGPRTPKDYLQGYFDYASKVSDGSLEMACRSLDRMSYEHPAFQISSNFNKDGFVRSVAEFIKRLGLTPSTIKENDAFGLDFVIEDSEKKGFGIGIECDAHCHPILETARAREIWRPKVLRLGIPFVHRVTCYGWYHRRTEEKEQLKQALEQALRVTFTGLSMAGWEDK